MNSVISSRPGRSVPGNLQVGYDSRAGAPEGVPYEFAKLIIACADRVYGTWWYIYGEGTPSAMQGWYIWIESLKLMGVTRGHKLLWRQADTLECDLLVATYQLST